ncbi:autotransporter outer membrane beta-barrel domain-containing protein [Stenoxybacter acetivorans]|uniref:autotransporter outer membrane beta-barrel domain-containing protein n=1 Tax=Stenoxybacter acetivorans TaxID=422441 RepID=UPI00056700C1|nr:autotransporter outer membrane beta-barrel domain-containing protein [Stenoxybacter acetivorans]
MALLSKKLNPLALALLTAFTPYSLAANVECSAPTGCTALSGDNMLVKAGDYQNKKLSPTELADEFASSGGSGGIQSRGVMVVRGSPNGTQPAEMTIKSGANIVVDTTYLADDSYAPYNEYYEINAVQALFGNVVLEKGAKITMTGQAANIEGGSAVDITQGEVNNQADIYLDAPGVKAFNVQPGVLTAKNHKITLTENTEQAIVALVGDSSGRGLTARASFDNVEIIGKGKTLIGFNVFEGGKIDFNKSSLNFTDSSSYAMLMEDGTVNITDSTIKSGEGIYLRSDPYSRGANTVNLKNSNLIIANNLVIVNDKRFTDAGDLLPAQDAKSQFLNLNADNSRLEGNITFDLTPAPQVNLTLSNNSLWKFNANSELDSLSLNTATVEFDKAGGFHTLTINGNLSGSNGLFKMNTDIANLKGDKLVVNGVVGGAHQIQVADSKNTPTDANGKLILVASQGGDGSFQLLDKYVDLGKYHYYLNQEGNDWILSATAAPDKPEPPVPPVTPGKPDTPEPPSGPTPPTAPEISTRANSLIGIRQAAFQQLYQTQQPTQARLQSLRQQQRDHGLWLNSDYGKWQQRNGYAEAGLPASGFKQHGNSQQLGYDRVFHNNAQTSYLGAFIGRSQSSVEFGGDYGNGSVKAVTAGIYGGWQHDNGWFADATYRYSRLTAAAPKIAESRWHAHSVALNGGKTLPVSTHWSLTPQAGVLAGRLSGNAETPAHNFMQTQIGIQAQGSYNVGGIGISPFIGAYWRLNRSNWGDVVLNNNNERLRISGTGSSGLYEAGISTDIGKQHNLTLKTTYGKGHYLKQDVGINVNYRYAW